MRASRRSAASLAFFRSRYCLSSSCFRLRLPASIAARNCSAAAAFTLRSISSSQSSCGAAHESCRTSRECRQYHGSVSEMRSATTAGTLRHLPHDSSSHATQLSDAANRPSMDASMGRADMAAHAASTSSTVSGGGGQSAGSPSAGGGEGSPSGRGKASTGASSRADANDDDAPVAPAPNAPSPAATRPSFSSVVHRGRTCSARWTSRAVARGSASIASTRHSRPGVSAMGAASISAATAFAAATAAVTGMTAGGDENRGGGGAIGAPAKCVSSSFTPAVVEPTSGGGFIAGIPTGGGSPGRWPTGTAGAVGAPKGSCAPFEGGSGAPWPPSIAPVVLRGDADPGGARFSNLDGPLGSSHDWAVRTPRHTRRWAPPDARCSEAPRWVGRWYRSRRAAPRRISRERGAARPRPHPRSPARRRTTARDPTRLGRSTERGRDHRRPPSSRDRPRPTPRPRSRAIA